MSLVDYANNHLASFDDSYHFLFGHHPNKYLDWFILPFYTSKINPSLRDFQQLYKSSTNNIFHNVIISTFGKLKKETVSSDQGFVSMVRWRNESSNKCSLWWRNLILHWKKGAFTGYVNRHGWLTATTAPRIIIVLGSRDRKERLTRKRRCRSLL